MGAAALSEILGDAHGSGDRRLREWRCASLRSSEGSLSAARAQSFINPSAEPERARNDTGVEVSRRGGTGYGAGGQLGGRICLWRPRIAGVHAGNRSTLLD